MGNHDSEKTRISRIITVVSFYVFSCDCYHQARRRKQTLKTASNKDTTVLWREEIENGPSLLMRKYKSSSNGTHTPHSLPSTPDTAISVPAPIYLDPSKPPTRPKLEREPTITVTSVRKSPNPPVNDLHPPVVSALPSTSEDPSWMVMPPPSRKAMQSLNRFINDQRNAYWGSPPARTISSAAGSMESGKQGSLDTTRSAMSRVQAVSLEMENMMAGKPVAGKVVQKPVRRARYMEGVLDDMEATRLSKRLSMAASRDDYSSKQHEETVPWSPVSPLTPATADWPRTPTTIHNPLYSPFDSPDSPIDSIAADMGMAPIAPLPRAAIRPLSLGHAMDGFDFDVDREIEHGSIRSR